MSFKLSAGSRKKLAGVHPDLVKVVERAIELTVIDFRVNEGLRTKARQAQLFKAGATRTMNSRHITGHAVDLVALVDGQERWDWTLYLKIAMAVRQAAIELKVPIVWGGTWKRLLGDDTITAAMLSKSFPDGPHYELQRSVYP